MTKLDHEKGRANSIIKCPNQAKKTSNTVKRTSTHKNNLVQPWQHSKLVKKKKLEITY